MHRRASLTHTVFILCNNSKEFFEKTKFSLVDGRLRPPEYTPDNIQFLNRCLFQLQLVLIQEKPSEVNGMSNSHSYSKRHSTHTG